MITNHKWEKVSETLPDTRGSLTSKPLMFLVNNREYYGHYHVNGFFYSIEGNFSTLAATGPMTDTSFRLGFDRKHIPNAEFWRYPEGR